MYVCKSIPVTGRGGPYCCETLRVPHFLDNRLKDGCKVSLTRRLPITPQEDSWYSFLLEAESTPGPYSIHLFRTRTRNLPACKHSASNNYATACPMYICISSLESMDPCTSFEMGNIQSPCLINLIFQQLQYFLGNVIGIELMMLTLRNWNLVWQA
jgi:hypothetical protein